MANGVFHQIFRAVTVVIFFIFSSFCIYGTQVVGLPLRLISKEWWHVWVDFTKQSFGILLIFITQFWAPLQVKISVEPELQTLFSVKTSNAGTESGDAETAPPSSHNRRLIGHFSPRAIVISNHQLYSDWIYLWWIAFTSNLHGNIFIMLKASLKKIPIWGWGMQHYRFIFLDRKWATDQKVLDEGLEYINQESQWPAWLAMFPEGTTFSRNGVAKSRAYGEKVNIVPPDHLLLPKSTGLRHTLIKLQPSVEFVYDATIHYDGIPEGIYGEDHYTLRNMYLRGVCPKRVAMYWRRYAIKDIPYQDKEQFDAWLLERWREKDAMLQRFKETGSFTDDQLDLPEVPVKLDRILQVFQIFSVPLNVFLIGNLLVRHLIPWIKG